MRKLAEQNGINIYSNAKTGYNKTTGIPKKPKKIGCSTLKKRFNDAGLGHLYKIQSKMSDKQEQLFTESPVYLTDNLSIKNSNIPLSLQSPDVQSIKNSNIPLSLQYDGPCSQFQYYRRGKCKNLDELIKEDCYGNMLDWDGNKCNLKPPSYEKAIKLNKCPDGRYFRGGKCKKFGDLTRTECDGDDIYWNETSLKCKQGTVPVFLPVVDGTLLTPEYAMKPGTSVVKARPIKTYYGYQ
jgi:hypothetical protein